MKNTALVILNYNNYQDTINCIESIEKYNSAPIKYIIVDNASTAEGVVASLDAYLSNKFVDGYCKLCDDDELPSKLSYCTFLASNTNNGFAGGNKKGLRLVYNDKSLNNVVILNNDILFVDDILLTLSDRLWSDEDIALVTPMVLDATLTMWDPGCARRCKTKNDLFGLYFSHLISPIKFKGGDSTKTLMLKGSPSDYIEDLEIGMPVGAFFMVKTRVLEIIDDFDPYTFLYYEEDILAEKLKDINKKSILIPSVRCVHLGAKSTSGVVSSFSYYHDIRSARYFMKRWLHASKTEYILFWILTYLAYAKVCILSYLKKVYLSNKTTNADNSNLMCRRLLYSTTTTCEKRNRRYCELKSLHLHNTQLKSIDLSKFIFAFFVVAIHTSLHFDNIYADSLLHYVESVSVPFFFAVSGFLLCRCKSDDLDSVDDEIVLADNISSALNKTLKLYILWSVLYIPINIYGEIFEWGHTSLVVIVASWVRNFIFTGDNYCSWILWYLNAYIVALSIVYFLLRYLKLNIFIISAISMCLYIVGWCYTEFHDSLGINLYDLLFVTTRNGIFRGFTFVCVGMMVLKLRLPRWYFSAIILVLGGVFNLSLLLPIVIYFLISFLLAIKLSGDNKIYIWLRQTSMNVYFLHMFFVFLFSVILNIVGNNLFFIVALVTIVFSSLLQYIIPKIRKTT